MINKLLIATGFSLSTLIVLAQPADSIHTQHLGEVVVTGQYKAQSIRNSVYQIKVVNSERIKLSGSTTVQQVLNNQLGFRFANDMALGTTDVQVNGMSGRNVKILIDGVPMIDRFDERVSLSQVDVNTIERIEIVEGPMSVSYGTDAMAGVINIITKKNNNGTLTVNAKVQEETAGNEYYPFSYQGVHNQAVNIGYKKNKLDFNIGGTHNWFNGYGGDTYGRAKDWLPKRQYFGNAKIGYTSNKLSIYYRLDALNEEIKDRNAINLSNFRTIDQNFNSDRFTHQLQADYNINTKWRYTGFVSYSNIKRETETIKKDFYNGTSELSTDDGAQDVSKLNSVSSRHTFYYIINEKFSLQPGIEFNREKATGQRILGEPEINDYAFFVSSEITALPKLSIRPGVRFVYNSQYNAPPAIPSLNLKYNINEELDFRAAYGYGFRAPALRELYFMFVDANHSIYGNENLKAEYSNSFNGSFTYVPKFAKAIALHTTLGGFYNSFKNQINIATDPADATKFGYFNLEDNTQTLGVNLENKITYKNLSATLGFIYNGMNSGIDQTGYTKQDSRDYLWTPEINSNIIYNIPNIKTQLGFFYKYVGKKPQFSYDNSTSTPKIVVQEMASYNLADFTITSQVHKWFTVSGGVKNVFDVKRVNSNVVGGQHSAGGTSAIGYGRSYFLGLAFNFSK